MQAGRAKCHSNDKKHKGDLPHSCIEGQEVKMRQMQPLRLIASHFSSCSSKSQLQQQSACCTGLCQRRTQAACAP